MKVRDGIGAQVSPGSSPTQYSNFFASFIKINVGSASPGDEKIRKCYQAKELQR